MDNNSFTYYTRPRLFSEEELWKRFYKGAFVITRKEKDDRTLVYGHAALKAFPSGFVSSDHFQSVREKLSTNEFGFKKIPPTEKTMSVDNSRIFECGKFSFFAQLNEVVDYAKRATAIYNANDIYLIIAVDSNINYGVLIGMTIDDSPDLKSFQRQWKDFSIEVIKYKELLEEYKSTEVGKNLVEKRKISDWLQKTTFAEFHRTIANRVLGQPSLSLITVAVYTYLKSLAEDNPNKVGILLAGSSGTGKTETYRALRDYFREQLPFLGFVQYDATSLTASGFKGNDVSFILKKVKEANSNGFCIAFIDEFDKKMCHELSSNGFDYNAALQSEFLTILEGGNSECNTANTLFILAGSFEKIRKEKANKRREIGFGENDSEDPKSCHAPITREEILENGALYELMGRLPVLVNYGPLNDDSLAEILQRKVEGISNTLGISIILEEHFQEDIIEQAKISKMGTRIFDQKIYEPAFLGFSEANQKGYPLETTTIKLGKNGYSILLSQEEEKTSYFKD